MDVRVEIKNMPKGVKGFIVVRYVKGELLYYGKYAKRENADSVSRSLIDSLVLEVIRSWE